MAQRKHISISEESWQLDKKPGTATRFYQGIL